MAEITRKEKVMNWVYKHPGVIWIAGAAVFAAGVTVSIIANKTMKISDRAIEMIRITDPDVLKSPDDILKEVLKDWGLVEYTATADELGNLGKELQEKLDIPSDKLLGVTISTTQWGSK